jgi:hypothetical protein
MFVHPSPNSQSSAGFLLILVLVLGSVFLLIVSSFIGYVVTQNEVVNFRHEQQRATEIAEAGLNYYRWFLAHYPGDVTNGTGLPGPYVKQYKDPEGGVIGEFSLDVSSNTFCGDIASIDITSTGHTYANPDAIARVSSRYKRPTVADYSFVINSGVWFGPSRVITGPVHGNQGVKMDGSHNSSVGSGQATFNCTSSFGCSPTISNADGVYSNSGLASPSLFQFPVSPIDFAGITLDLADIKDKAQNGGGVYYGPTGGYGYRVIFNSNDTIDVFRVTDTYNYQSYSSTEGYHYGERNVITNQTQLANDVAIDPSCPVLFFEDKTWIEGQVNQKVSIAAADLSSANQTNIVINGNLTYGVTADAGLIAIAEDDIDIGVNVSNNLTANGIYLAQNGRFGRNFYSTSWFSNTYDQYVTRNSLTRLGTVVSNGRSGTAWIDGTGVTVSGFLNRDTSFDLNQVNNPPPLTPATSDVYSFEDWRQDG